MAINRDNWPEMAVSITQEAASRWLSVWGAPVRDALALLAAAPITRSLARGSAEFYHEFSQGLVALPHVDDRLDFTVDKVAEASSPLFIKVPNGWENVDDFSNLEVLAQSPIEGIPLREENVTLRREDGLLSVTLIDLQNRQLSGNAPQIVALAQKAPNLIPHLIKNNNQALTTAVGTYVLSIGNGNDLPLSIRR